MVCTAKSLVLPVTSKDVSETQLINLNLNTMFLPNELTSIALTTNTSYSDAVAFGFLVLY